MTRQELEQCKMALETQTRVCETLEHERDRANDDYEFAQVRTMLFIKACIGLLVDPMSA